MKEDFFDMYIQVIDNMSDNKVTIYTSPKNKAQIEIMMLHLKNVMGSIEEEGE